LSEDQALARHSLRSKYLFRSTSSVVYAVYQRPAFTEKLEVDSSDNSAADVPEG
jgi:hypothetical protein